MKFRLSTAILIIALSFFAGFGESNLNSEEIWGGDYNPEAEVVDQVSDSTLTEYVE